MSEDMARRHLAEGTITKIGDDSFNFKPIGTLYIADIMKLMSEMVVFKDLDEADFEDHPEKLFAMFNEDTTNRIIKLGKATINSSYPDWSDEIVDRFIASNFFKMFFVICELNKFDGGNDNIQQKNSLNRIEELKSRVPKNNRRS